MKRLYLLRHAKSSWGTPAVPDHERPLNARGQGAARIVGLHLSGLAPLPEAVLASTARRVSQTLEILLPAANLAAVPVLRDRGLYLAQPSTLLGRLRQAPPNADCLMFVGHNPGLHDFALRIAGDIAAENLRAREALRGAYPTCALAILDFPLAENWLEIGWGAGRLEGFITPKGLA